jgi:hypothetical protein
MTTMAIKTPLDPNLALFSAAELAAVSGLSRGTVDLWGSRGLLLPTRRERMPRTTKARPRKGHGRPMFSMAAIFRARLAHDLGAHLGIGLSEWLELSDLIEASEVTHRGWMEAVANAVETNDATFKVHAWVTRIDGKWKTTTYFIGDLATARLNNPQLDMKPKPEEPKFWTAVPNIVIPMSDIFAAVYRECKKLLGEE